LCYNWFEYAKSLQRCQLSSRRRLHLVRRLKYADSLTYINHLYVSDADHMRATLLRNQHFILNEVHVNSYILCRSYFYILTYRYIVYLTNRDLRQCYVQCGPVQYRAYLCRQLKDLPLPTTAVFVGVWSAVSALYGDIDVSTLQKKTHSRLLLHETQHIRSMKRSEFLAYQYFKKSFLK